MTGYTTDDIIEHLPNTTTHTNSPRGPLHIHLADGSEIETFVTTYDTTESYCTLRLIPNPDIYSWSEEEVIPLTPGTLQDEILPFIETHANAAAAGNKSSSPRPGGTLEEPLVSFYDLLGAIDYGVPYISETITHGPQILVWFVGSTAVELLISEYAGPGPSVRRVSARVLEDEYTWEEDHAWTLESRQDILDTVIPLLRKVSETVPINAMSTLRHFRDQMDAITGAYWDWDPEGEATRMRFLAAGREMAEHAANLILKDERAPEDTRQQMREILDSFPTEFEE